MRRAEWKAKWATSGAIIWCRFRGWRVWKSGTSICSQDVAPTSSVGSRANRTRWASAARQDAPGHGLVRGRVPTETAGAIHTAANLVNELVEARQQNAVKRVLVRWLRYDVIVLDEVGYVPLAEIGAEFLFQVIAERAERAALIVTTNLPFSEWTQVFSNPRLCKALLDRITDRAHIIETGTESYRFRRTLEVRQKKKAS